MYKMIKLFSASVGLMMVGLLVCAGSYADLWEGLVAAWTFDDGTAKDQTGNKHDGKIVGKPQPVRGKFGVGFDFNGKDTGVEVEDHEALQLADPFTIAAWIYPRAIVDASGIDHAGIVWKGNMIGWGSNVYNYRIAMHLDSGLTWGACAGGTEGYFHTGNCIPRLNQWYHTALVENGTEGIAYLDGVALADADVTGGDMHRPSAPYDVLEGQPVRIGWSQGYNGDIGTEVYFDGIIDEVFIYSRPLDENEVNELMNGALNFPVEPAGRLVVTWAQIKAY
jgi:hypothetical protein